MKKIILAILMLTVVIAFQNSSHAQDLGVGDILFEKNPIDIPTHGSLMNELSYNIIKLHIFIAEKDIETANYEGEALATIKRLEELTKTDVIELLDISVNKEEALAKYLADCDQELQK